MEADAAMSDALAPYDEAYFRARYRPDDPPNASARAVASALVSRYAPSRTLDVGCGVGVVLRAFLEKGADAWGVEGAQAAIDLSPARDRIRRVDLTRDRFPFPDAHFDLVTSIEVVEHLATEEPWMSEVARVLRPGGVFYLQTPNPWSKAARMDPTHVNVRSKFAWARALKRRGLATDAGELRALDRLLPIGHYGSKLPAWVRYGWPVQAVVVHTGTRTVFRKP